MTFAYFCTWLVIRFDGCRIVGWFSETLLQISQIMLDVILLLWSCISSNILMSHILILKHPANSTLSMLDLLCRNSFAVSYFGHTKSLHFVVERWSLLTEIEKFNTHVSFLLAFGSKRWDFLIIRISLLVFVFLDFLFLQFLHDSFQEFLSYIVSNSSSIPVFFYILILCIYLFRT